MSPNDRRALRPFGSSRDIKRNFHRSGRLVPPLRIARCVHHPSLSPPFFAFPVVLQLKGREGGRIRGSGRKTVVTVGRFKDDGNSNYRYRC